VENCDSLIEFLCQGQEKPTEDRQKDFSSAGSSLAYVLGGERVDMGCL
jgi:hypothetical protein